MNYTADSKGNIFDLSGHIVWSGRPLQTAQAMALFEEITDLKAELRRARSRERYFRIKSRYLSQEVNKLCRFIKLKKYIANSNLSPDQELEILHHDLRNANPHA